MILSFSTFYPKLVQAPLHILQDLFKDSAANVSPGARYNGTPSQVLWRPCVNKSELFWWQREDLHSIKQVVLMFACSISEPS